MFSLLISLHVSFSLLEEKEPLSLSAWSPPCYLVAESCPTLCDPMDCSPPGSSVYEISQARILEWLSFPLPVDLPYPEIKPHPLYLLHWQVGSLPLAPPGKLYMYSWSKFSFGFFVRYNSKEHFGQPNKWMFTISLFLMTKKLLKPIQMTIITELNKHNETE